MNSMKLLPFFLLMGVPTLMALDNKQMDTIGAFVKNKQYADWDVEKAEMYLQQVRAALPKAGSTAKGKLERYKNWLESGVVAARQAHITDAKKEIVELKKIVPAIPAADIKAIENVVNNAKPDQNENEFLKSLRKNELFQAREAALNIEKTTPKAKVGAIQQALRAKTPPPSQPLPIFTDKPLIKPGTPPAVFDPNMPLPLAPGTAEPVLPAIGTPLPAPIPLLPEPGSILPPPLPGAKLVIPTPPPFPGTKPLVVQPTPTVAPKKEEPKEPAGRVSPTQEELQQIKLKKVNPTSQASLKEQIVEANGNLKESQENLKKMKDEATKSDNKLKDLEKALEPEKTKLATMKTALIQKTAKITPTNIANQEKIVLDKKAEIDALKANILSQKNAITKQEQNIDFKNNLVKDLNELFSLEKQINKTEKDNARIKTLKQIIELEKKDNLGTQDILQLNCLKTPEKCPSEKEEKQEQTEEEKAEWGD
jgi:hypothetical protein